MTTEHVSRDQPPRNHRGQRLDELDRAWLAFWRFTAQHPDGYITEVRISGDWSAADVLMHMARWETAAREAVEAHRAGQPVESYKDYEAWNARWREEDRDPDPVAARGRAAAAYLEFRALLDLIPEDAWDKTVDGWAKGSVDHYREHVEDSVAEVLAHEEEEWRRIVAVLDARPDGVLHREEGVTWEARTIYAHLARWTGQAATRIGVFFSGQPMPGVEAHYNDLNAKWLAEDATVPFQAARDRAFASRQRLRDLMTATPAMRWDAYAYNVFDGNSRGHYLEHLGYMGRAEEQ